MFIKQQRVARYVVGMNLHGKLGVLASRKDAERGAFWTNRPGLQEFVGRPRHSKHWSSDREGHRPLTAQQDAVFLLDQVIRPTPGVPRLSMMTPLAARPRSNARRGVTRRSGWWR